MEYCTDTKKSESEKIESLVSHPEFSQQNSWESTGLRKAMMSSGAYTTCGIIKALDVNKCPQNSGHYVKRANNITYNSS